MYSYCLFNQMIIDKHTLTIAIPAHNEQATIGSLLHALLRQVTKSAIVEKIVVLSDGSKDQTVAIVNNMKDKRIELIEKHHRLGRAVRQNQIIDGCHSDILVFLDSDITITDRYFIDRLISPIVQNTADMTSSALEEMKPRTFFEEVLDVSMKLKNVLFQTYKNGNNIYTCHGPARAIRKKLYRNLHFPVSEGEDMYSYLVCISQNYRFQYVPDAVVKYHLPATISDHCKQSLRYLGAQEQFTHSFHTKLALEELRIPLRVFIIAGFKSVPIVFQYPLHILFYLSILIYVKLLSVLRLHPEEMWRVASSKG